MTKTQRDLVIASITVSLFLGASWNTFQTLSKKRRAPVPAAEVPSSVETQLLEDAKFIGSVREAQQTSEEQGRRWELEWERDPFQDEGAAAQAVGVIQNLALTGVFWDPEHPRVVLNGKMAGLHDTVDGYKIMKISPNSVLLWTGEKEMELRVFGSPDSPQPPQA